MNDNTTSLVLAQQPTPAVWIGVLKKLLQVLALPVIIVVLWALLASAINSLVLPTPLEAVQGLMLDFQRPEYIESIFVTVRLLLFTWVLSVVVGALVGFTLGLSNFWSTTFSTPLFAIYSLPFVTLYPVFLLLTGIGETTQVLFAFAHGVIPMALLVMGATKDTDRMLLKLGESLELNRWQIIRKIVIPGLIPTLVSASRLAFGLTVIGLLLAGMISASSGLGHELVNNIANVRMGRITGQVMFIIVLAVIPGLLLRAIESKVSKRFASE